MGESEELKAIAGIRRDLRIANERRWTAHGVGVAVHLLIEAGVPPEYHESLHEYIDEYELSVGNTKREPRSQKWKRIKTNG